MDRTVSHESDLQREFKDQSSVLSVSTGTQIM